MQFNKYILIFVTLFIVARGYQAQNIHFSQYEAPQSFLNPALTGQFNGDWRAGGSIRDQWRSISNPYKSFIGFYDQHFYHYNKEINAGLIYLYDQSGAAKLTAHKLYLSLAYPIRRGRSTISIGVQPGVVIKYYDHSQLTYPSQYDDETGYFNPDLVNYENENDYRQIVYFDLNAGLLWKFNLPKFKPTLGFAVFHLTTPNESFSKSTDKKYQNELKSRQVIHGNATIGIKRDLYLKPSFAFHDQNTANMFMIGSDIGKKFLKNQSIVKEVFAGVYIRNGYARNTDAIIPVFGFQFNNWRFGWSYDVNVSGLDVATETKGAYELSIIYTAPSSLPKHTTIPCERY
jgi:type IX secretion system PorP/SprF family membrane protein